MSEVLSVESLVTDLRRLGISEGDTVMVHVSLRAIGPIQGGADGLIAALDQSVGAEGTLLAVLGARNEWAWVNKRTEAERAGCLEGAEPFDALRAPADPEVGVFAEVFRCHPGTLVSDHPEGRFAARGRRAAALVANPPWDDYFGPGSALERLVERDGKVLRLGADPDTTTLLHYAEYLSDLPTKRRARRHRLVTTPTGPAVRVIDCLDDEHGIVDYVGEDYFAAVLKAYLRTGAGRGGTVGCAASELIDARNMVSFAVAWMNTHLMPGPAAASEAH